MIEPRHSALPADVLERIDEFLGAGVELGTVEQLRLPKLVDDYCDKFVALDLAGRPAAFIVVSPQTHPDSVRDAAEITRSIQTALGPGLGTAVLVPYFVGDIQGRSYSITAYCQPMSKGRLSGRWQRLRMTPAILSWLEAVARTSMKEVADIEADIRNPLMALAGHDASDDATRIAASVALGELDLGRWRPRSVVAHNDLWWGNFVHRRRGDGSPFPFHVIDWAGACLEGMPFYDLVRVASSLNVTGRRFRQVLRAHCTVLDCRPEHSRNYLCVAFGRLLRNLGEWPEEQFVSTARSCLRFVDAALGELPQRSSTASMK
jgi:hypothetical protein